MGVMLSIVIANYNYGRFLETAIRSVVGQKGFDRCELIVVDGGSNDESVEVIKRYADKISWWCSERDAGQSDAFNKGFSHARGRFLTWLNADEFYLPGAFERLLTYIERHPQARWITANDFSYHDSTRKILKICWGPHYIPPFMTGDRVPPVVFGPSSFFAREIYDKVGQFDVSLHFGMDTDLWRRMSRAGCVQSRLNCFCWAFRVHDACKTFGVQTDESQAQKRSEAARERDKFGCPYRRSLLNFWYVVWMLCRLLDGSLLVQAYKRLRFRGRLIDELVHG